jgi:streptogrisin C
MSGQFPIYRRRSVGKVAGAATTVLILISLLAGAGPAVAEPVEDLVDPAVADLAAAKGLSVAEAARRIGWQEHAASLSDAVEAAVGPNQFGGVWVADDDRVTVGVLAGAVPVDGLRSSIANLASSIGLESAGLNVVSVRYSLATLVEANEWIADQVEAANAGADSYLTGGGYSPADSAVWLGIPPAPAVITAAQQAVVTQARQRYGDMLTTYTAGPAVPAACSAHYCDVPLRGGVRFAGGLECTLGFIGRSRANGRLYAITAGHCLRVPNGFTTRSRFASGPTNHIIGPARNSVFGGPGDAGIIEITNYTGWRPRAWLYVTASQGINVPGTVRNESYPIRRDNVSLRGLRVCKREYALGTSCGRVARLGATITYEGGPTVRNLAVAFFCSRRGDSGGPIFAGNTAYGILSGLVEGDCTSYYQGIRGAENLMNFNVSFD